MVGDSDILFHRRTLGHCQFNLFCDVSIIHTDDSLDGSTCVAIDNVVLGQHVGGRNDDGTNLTQGQHDNPPLVATLQNQHHRVALADT